MGLIASLLIFCLVYGWHLLQKWRMLPSLFVPRRVETVHYDLVQVRLTVRSVVCRGGARKMTWSNVVDEATPLA